MLGILHSLILKAALISLSTASFILEGNAYTLPIRVTLIIDVVISVTIITFPLWHPFLASLVDNYAIKRV